MLIRTIKNPKYNSNNNPARIDSGDPKPKKNIHIKQNIKKNIEVKKILFSKKFKKIK